MPKSILDQVLSSQRLSAISNFDPISLHGKFFSILNERERDILINRYGLTGEKKVTLEDIGDKYSVTRERVRQIENASLRRIKEHFKNDIIKDVEMLIRNLLDEHGEMMSEKRLIETLLSEKAEDVNDTAFIRFLINQVVEDRLQLQRESDLIYKTWATPGASWVRFHQLIEKLTAIIEEHGEPLQMDFLLERFKRKHGSTEIGQKFDAVLINYLDITKKIEENIFEELGLSHWSSIRPRRMNDKIYLIMKRDRKPLHFTEIAKKINEAGFDKRVAYPATIHNELILDDNYVLVGRGIYALKEWGYKPGIVLDVIKEILRESTKPLTREEIVSEVLKNRMVKRSTIVLALMNKEHFARDDEGKYTLVAD